MSEYSWILAIPRQVGHTEAAIKSEAVVIVRDHRAAQALHRRNRTAYGLEAAPLGLQGRMQPVVFDTDTVQLIVYDLLEQIAELTERLSAQEDPQ